MSSLIQWNQTKYFKPAEWLENLSAEFDFHPVKESDDTEAIVCL